MIAAQRLLGTGLCLWLLVGGLGGAVEAAILGTCERYALDIESSQALWVIQEGAPAYDGPAGDAVVRTLNLGQMLDLQHKVLTSTSERGRIPVEEGGEPIGWMDRSDLLCRSGTLKNKAGIERKLYISPPPAPHGEPATVKAYPDSAQTSCQPRCLELTRFQLYYVYAEDDVNQTLLVSSKYSMKDEYQLTGWVRKEDGVQWDTAIGLRPADDVEATFIYRTLEDAQNLSAERFPVVGNKDRRWYRYKQRMPVLDLVGSGLRMVYKVAAPSVGASVGNNPLDDHLDEVDLESLKNTDIFFLIDGTASMGPHIRAVQDTVKEIADTLPGKSDFRESYLRFGFRIFRDDYADRTNPECKGGVCEGMPLSHSTCKASSKAGAANLVEFNSRLGWVKATANDQDDYPEKLFDGIRQAIEDISSCPGNKKVLFIVGDHGDREKYAPSDLIDELKRFDKPVVVFFVQTPNQNKGRKYADAYMSFSNQAMDILDQVYPKDAYEQEVDPYSYFIKLSDDLPSIVEEKVGLFARSGDINSITEALRGGHSLDGVLKDLMNEVDLPVLYWEVIRQHACSGLGKQCSERVDHRVIEAYVPVGDDWREEIWMTGDDIANWGDIRTAFENFSETQPASLIRRELVATLATTLEKMVGKPRISESGERIGDYIRSRGKGLPINEDSPLMQYELKDFFKAPTCELRQLNQWVTDVLKLMSRMQGAPTIKLKTQAHFAPPLSCKRVMIHQVPRLDPPKSDGNLGPDESYSYMHEFDQRQVLWYPKELMP